MLIRASFTALLCLILGACGFSPLYSTQGEEGVLTAVRTVHLAKLDGPAEPSRYLQEALSNALPGVGGNDARYQLTVDLSDQRRAIAVTRSADTTRFDYFLNAAYVLVDTDTGVTRRQRLDTVVSYGVVESQYASRVGREDAVRRAAVELARKIELDIALFLKGRAPEPSDVTLPEILDREIIEGASSTSGSGATP